MHLVFLNQFFPPDLAPTGVMMRAVIQQLLNRGHRVTVIAGSVSYAHGEEGSAPGQGEFTAEGLSVLRVPCPGFRRGRAGMKLASWAIYGLFAGVRLAFLPGQVDRVVGMTSPPFLSVVSRALSKWRGGDHAHWVMDLYPDALSAAGILSEDHWLYRWLQSLARWGFGGARCSGVMAIAPDMKERLGVYVRGEVPTGSVPLWFDDGSSDKPYEAARAAQALRRERGWSDEEVVYLYSGNVGPGHAIDVWLGLAQRLAEQPDDTPARFVFSGGGSGMAQIQEFVKAHPDVRVETSDYVSRDRLMAHLQSADVHLISQDPCWDGIIVPSKLQASLTCRRPVLYCGSLGNALGVWIEESGAGWCVALDDGEGLYEALTASLGAEERRRRGEAGGRFAEKVFSCDENASEVATFLARA